MAYWKFAFHRAWIETWNLLTGGIEAAVVGVAIFTVTAFLAHKIRGKEELKEWIWDGILGVFATLIVGFFVFLTCLLVTIPMQVYEQNKTLESAMTTEREAINGKDQIITQKDVDLKNANDRAEALSDAAIKGRADVKDEPIASATATCDFTIESEVPYQGGTSYMNPGAAIVFVQNSQPLIIAQAEQAFSQSSDGGRTLEYKIKASAPADGPWMGAATGTIGKANAVIVHIAKGILPVGSKITGGHVVWVINNETAQRFEVPPQPAQECENGNSSGFTIPLIPGSDFNSLQGLVPSPTPDSLALPH